jgi:formylglycine-generating enzyme required for sulfatase activity
MAAAYCNWLSDQEGLKDQQCYEMNPKGRVTRLKENYLSLTGYRLPTEAEWEYACRSGAVTSRYYGESEELLENYAWYAPKNEGRIWPVGGKKPNDLGLFDMYGNVVCWCQERYKDYSPPKDGGVVEDKEDDLNIYNSNDRVMRGHGVPLRSACRGTCPPTLAADDHGFRPARTFLP